MDILIAAMAGIGIAMLWQRAEPLRPVRSFAIIRLNRLFDWLAARSLPKYPVWWLKGILGCEACLCPWAALVVGVAMSLHWNALIAMPVAFAVYTMTVKLDKP